MKHLPGISAAVLAVLLLSGPFASAVETDTLRLYQSSHQRSRQIARELITEVLDTQLEQFRFNGLDKLPIYRDILSMRRNVDRLVDTEMKDVLDLLTKAQRAGDGDRQRLFVQARTEVRQIVRTLAAERQKLLQRMRVSKVAGQTERLISLQRDTMTMTRSLPGISSLDLRETRAVAAVQDQRDVGTLYLQLVDELSAMSGWGPPAGPAAADGLRMLRAHKVHDHLTAASRLLERVEYNKAAAEQKAVIDGLSAVLYEVGEASGRSQLNFAQLLHMVTNLQRRQEVVHSQTQKTPKADTARTAALSTSQRDIHRDIGVLADRLSFLPPVKPHLELAKASALKATGALLAGQFPAALAPQQSVLTSLARIEARLRLAEQFLTANKSADELSDEVKALTQLDAALGRIRAQHGQVEAQVLSAPGPAAALEKRVADELAAEQKKYPSLPDTVSSRLEQAHTAATEAVKRIPAGGADARAATRATGEALDHAHAEVKRALADARRRALGVKIGELARAIDALERAAVAERAQAVRARAAAGH